MFPSHPMSRRPCSQIGHKPLGHGEAFACRVLEFIDCQPDSRDAFGYLQQVTKGEFYLVGGLLRRLLFGSHTHCDIDIIVPNADDRAFQALDELKVPTDASSSAFRRYKWNNLQLDIFQPRQYGMTDIDSALRHFDLRINAIAFHVGSGLIVDPFGVLRGGRSDPGINWPSWSSQSTKRAIIHAIRLDRIMKEIPQLTISQIDAARLLSRIAPEVESCEWSEVSHHTSCSKSAFLEQFISLLDCRIHYNPPARSINPARSSTIHAAQ